MMIDKSWTVTVEQDPETGECVLPFPPDLLEGLGWIEGDMIEWIDNNDGTWILRRKDESKS